jgi:DNA-binding LacI/PurR family transcriptional regulator
LHNVFLIYLANFSHLFCAAILDVPRDMSVIGFDHNNEHQMLDKALTTVGQDLFAIGQKAVSIITKQMKSSSKPQKLLVPVKLVEGETVRDFLKGGQSGED